MAFYHCVDEWSPDFAQHRDGRDRTRFALSRLDIFRGLSREEYRLLEPIVQPMQFEKGEEILQEGDPANPFFVVARGTVRVSLVLDRNRT